jgi:hypothetical protein
MTDPYPGGPKINYGSTPLTKTDPEKVIKKHR